LSEFLMWNVPPVLKLWSAQYIKTFSSVCTDICPSVVWLRSFHRRPDIMPWGRAGVLVRRHSAHYGERRRPLVAGTALVSR